MAKSKQRWLHSSSLPCLIWTVMLQQQNPHIIIHECVQGFNPDYFDATLPNHVRLSLVFAPTDLGVPTQRLVQTSWPLCLILLTPNAHTTQVILMGVFLLSLVLRGADFTVLNLEIASLKLKLAKKRSDPSDVHVFEGVEDTPY
eukprot:6483461-Amphidinium_carterae.1